MAAEVPAGEPEADKSRTTDAQKVPEIVVLNGQKGFAEPTVPIMLQSRPESGIFASNRGQYQHRRREKCGATRVLENT